jgi:hypothetical protein
MCYFGQFKYGKMMAKLRVHHGKLMEIYGDKFNGLV